MNKIDLQILKEALDVLGWLTDDNGNEAYAALDKVIADNSID